MHRYPLMYATRLSNARNPSHNQGYRRPLIEVLPDEMLEAVFDTYVSAIHDAKGDMMGLVRCSHVCRWFRTVALSCPRLWRFIDSCRAILSVVFLKRSGLSVPLCIANYSDKPQPLISILLLSFRRAQIHQIVLDSCLHNMRYFLEKSGGVYPKLYELGLQKQICPEDMHLAGITFDCDLSTVKRLTLVGSSVRWSSLTDLTHLSLFDFQLLDKLSLPIIYTLLADSPRLQQFALGNANFLGYEQSRVSIALPCLQEIHLQLLPRCVSCLLASLTIPMTAKLRISSFSATDGFQSLFPVKPTSPHLHLRVTKQSSLSIRLKAIHLRQSHTEAFADASHLPELLLEMPVPPPSYAWMLTHIPQLMDTYKLTQLEVDIIWVPNYEEVADSLRTLLNASPNLLTLRVAQHGAECVSMVLGNPGSDRLDDDVVCPRLERLSFGTPDQIWWGFPIMWVQPVVDCLRDRATCTGQLLMTLEFIGKGRFDWDSAQSLMPYVEEIVNSLVKL